MDQIEMVDHQYERGWNLIQELASGNFETQVAFWARYLEEKKWYLHLCSPYVDEHGPGEAYALVFRTLRARPELRIDHSQIKVLGMKDSLTEAAIAILQSAAPDSPFAVQPSDHFKDERTSKEPC